MPDVSVPVAVRLEFVSVNVPPPVSLPAPALIAAPVSKGVTELPNSVTLALSAVSVDPVPCTARPLDPSCVAVMRPPPERTTVPPASATAPSEPAPLVRTPKNPVAVIFEFAPDAKAPGELSPKVVILAPPIEICPPETAWIADELTPDVTTVVKAVDAIAPPLLA